MELRNKRIKYKYIIFFCVWFIQQYFFPLILPFEQYFQIVFLLRFIIVIPTPTTRKKNKKPVLYLLEVKVRSFPFKLVDKFVVVLEQFLSIKTNQ